MAEFITGLVLGGLLVFCLMEFHRWKSYMISQSSGTEKTDSNGQYVFSFAEVGAPWLW